VVGFVEEEDLRRMDQRTDHSQLLLHPTRKVLSPSFPKGLQIGKLKEPLYPFPSFPLRDLIEISVEMDVFKNGEIPVEPQSLGRYPTFSSKTLPLPNVTPCHRCHLLHPGRIPHSIRSVVVFPEASGPTRQKSPLF